MPSETASTTEGHLGPSHAETVYNHAAIQNVQECNQPQRGRECPPRSRNASNNAGNLDICQRVHKLVATIVQKATVITHANGVPIPPEVEKLGV